MARHVPRLVVAGALLAAALPAPALAARAPITGKLDRSGYTVIAITSSGQARSVRATRGSFAFRPPAAAVSLHLRARDGTYAGPIVVGRDGTHAIVGVRAGARLGAITVRVRSGDAKPTRRVPARWQDRSRWARARAGVPIGAGRFGRVRSVPPRAAPTGDRDADGIANPLDIDDDGDLVLDDVERRPARAAQATGGTLSAFTLLYQIGNATFPPAGPLTQPVNASAGMPEADIEAALRKESKLSIGDSSRRYRSAELDCRGLTYCSTGGSGRHEPPGGNSVTPAPGVAPFPACCDADGDGLGAFDLDNGSIGLFLHPGAASDQIRAGDVLIGRGECATPCGPDGSKSIELAATLGSVFATVPAIARYTDELGVTHDLRYPLTPTGSDFPREGSRGTEIEVLDGPDSGDDVSVTLTFWRPQRRAVPAEVPAGTSTWIDMGGLTHFAHTLGGSSTTWCPADSYSAVAGGLAPTTLVIPGSSPQGDVPASVFRDTAPDQAATPDHVFAYTLNLTRCFAARGHPFAPGARVALVFDAMLAPSPGGPLNFAEAGYVFSRRS